MAFPLRTCGGCCDLPRIPPFRGNLHEDPYFRTGDPISSTARCVADGLTAKYAAVASSCEATPDVEVGREGIIHGDLLVNAYGHEWKGIGSGHAGARPPPDTERAVAPTAVKIYLLEESDEEKLSSRLMSLSRSNKVRSALELFMSMEAAELRPKAHACNSLISCLVRNRSYSDALQVFEIMRLKEMVTSHACSMILKAVELCDGAHPALEMFNQLASEHSSKGAFDVIVYNTVLAICARAHNWVDAEKIWRKLVHDEVRGSLITYKLLVSTFVQCHQTELVIGAYHDMIKNGLEPSEDILKAVIAACSKEGNWELAVSALRRMIDCKMMPNIVALNSVINTLAKAGKVELSFEIYCLLRDLGLQADVYTWSALSLALYRSGRYSDVLKLFQHIKIRDSLLVNTHIYSIALMSCQRLCLWEHAIQLLWELERRELPLSAASYNHVLSACEAARKPKVALEVYQRMIHRKCSPDMFTYLSIIRACVWGSLWTEIEDLLEHVAADSSLYNALIHGFCLRGKTTLAKKLYEKMRRMGMKPDGKTRALMLQHLNKKGDGR